MVAELVERDVFPLEQLIQAVPELRLQSDGRAPPPDPDIADGVNGFGWRLLQHCAYSHWLQKTFKTPTMRRMIELQIDVRENAFKIQLKVIAGRVSWAKLSPRAVAHASVCHEIQRQSVHRAVEFGL